MVSGTVSLLCERCFSPFPHGTGSLSVSGECLALADGPAGFTQGSDSHRVPRAPRYSGARLGFRRLRIRDCHPLRSDFPDCSPQRRAFLCRRSYNPSPAGTGLVWALPRSLATTGGITFCFLFLWVLRCFSSPGSPSHYCGNDWPPASRVAPFGRPRITGRLHLPAAFRSLPRPSSPSGA